MNKLRIGIVAVLLLVAITLIGLVSAQRSEQGQKTAQDKHDEPTVIQEGVMTDRQREHGKLFKNMGVSRKIVDLLQDQDEVHLNAAPGLISEYPGSERSSGDLVKFAICQSDAVVMGTVVSKESQLTDDGFSLFTDYTISVETVLKNDGNKSIQPEKTIIVAGLGGEVRLNGHLVTAFTPTLPIGEKYLFFLNGIPSTGAFQFARGAPLVPASADTSPKAVKARSSYYKTDIGTITELIKSSVHDPCPAKR